MAYTGALSLGWIGIAIFGPDGLTDRENVMPAVIMKVFHPVVAAVLMTGAIAAMTSTANSLLILSATELSENLIKPAMKKSGARNSLLHSRIITSILAIVALIIADILPQEYIFTLVSYVWAGIGGTFSVVVLLSLFWKKYHGKAVLATIISGLTFTIIWISTGMDEVVTSRLLTFFVAGIVAITFTYLLPKKTAAI